MGAGHNRQNWLGNGDGHKTRSSAQRGAAAEDCRTAFSGRTGHEQGVAVDTLIGIPRTDERQLRKFMWLDPTQTSFADFFDERARRADLHYVQRAGLCGVVRLELANLWRGEGYGAMGAEDWATCSF